VDVPLPDHGLHGNLGVERADLRADLGFQGDDSGFLEVIERMARGAVSSSVAPSSAELHNYCADMELVKLTKETGRDSQRLTAVMKSNVGNPKDTSGVSFSFQPDALKAIQHKVLDGTLHSLARAVTRVLGKENVLDGDKSVESKEEDDDLGNTGGDKPFTMKAIDPDNEFPELPTLNDHFQNRMTDRERKIFVQLMDLVSPGESLATFFDLLGKVEGNEIVILQTKRVGTAVKDLFLSAVSRNGKVPSNINVPNLNLEPNSSGGSYNSYTLPAILSGPSAWFVVQWAIHKLIAHLDVASDDY